MGLLNKFTIRTNLIFAFTTTLIILTLLFIISLYQTKTTEKIDKIYLNSIKIKNYMYKLEKDEHKFRTYKDDEYIEDFKKHFRRINKFIDRFDADFKKIENQTKEINKLKAIIYEYGKGFNDFIRWNRKIGEERGFLYYLNISKNGFIIKNSRVLGYDFSKYFLDLELTVKEFLLSNNIKYSAEFNKKFNLLEKTINNKTGLNEKSKNELTFYLKEYKRYFAKVIEISTIIGSSLESGIIGDMKTEVYKAQEKIDFLIKRAEKLKSKTLRRVIKNSEISEIILSLILALVILYSLKRVDISTQELENLSLNLSLESRDLLIKIDLEDKKSFRKITDNLNQFISNMQGVVKDHKLLSVDSLNLIKKTKSDIIGIKDRSEKLDELLIRGDELSKNLKILIPNISQQLKREDELIIAVSTDNERSAELTESIKINIEDSSIYIQDIFNNFYMVNESISTGNSERIESLIEIVESLKITAINSAIESSKIGKNGEKLSILADDIMGIEKKISEKIEAWKREQLINRDQLLNINKLLIKSSSNISLAKINSINLDNKLVIFKERMDRIFKIVISVREKLKMGKELSAELFENIERLKSENLDNIDISKNSYSLIVKLEEIQKKIVVELNHLKV